MAAIQVFKAVLRRGTIWAVRAFAKRLSVDGMEVLLLDSGRDEKAVVHQLRLALDEIGQVGSSWRTRVQAELHTLVVTSSRSGLWPIERISLLPLSAREMANPLYLGSRFVWLATYLRDASVDAEKDVTAIRDQAYEDQIQFLRSHGGAMDLEQIVLQQWNSERGKRI